MKTPSTKKFLAALCLSLICLHPVSHGQEARLVIPSSPNASYWSDGRQIPFEIYHNRIGIQTRTGVPGLEIRELAEAEGFEIGRTFYRGIFELELSDPLLFQNLSARARALEARYEDQIKTAGFFVQASNSSVPWILTNKILIVFEEGLSEDERRFLLENYPLEDLELLYGCDSIYVSTVDGELTWDVPGIAESLRTQDDVEVRYAHPNFIAPIISRGSSDPPVYDADGNEIDPRLSEQWHHDNEGDGDATWDADIDSMEAWQLSSGNNSNPLLAIIDSGFSTSHPDLRENLWTDEDGITRGRDFDDDDHTSLIDDIELPNPHGTAVAGIAGAIGNNTDGGRGVCPDCQLLLLRHGGDTDSATRAICFAIEKGAKVISNSWSPEGVTDSTIQAIGEATYDNDIPVLFAMASVVYQDNCDEDPIIDLSSLPNVIAVSSVTDQDSRTNSGFGNCMDVLAPSRRGSYYGITTTGVFHDSDTGGTYDGPLLNFGGTSAATPMVAGTIGLMLDADPNLSRIQIQRIIQDTADKIDPVEGHYDSETGFSNPCDSTATHAYGRINAFEAVSLVAPFDAAETDLMKRGHGGKDLLLRDHALDWGNTERPSSEKFTPTEPREETSVNRSVDIKTDVYPYEIALSTPAEFVEFDSEDPVASAPLRVYVRLRNRGPDTVADALLKLHWTVEYPPPRLQDDFWTSFPNDTADPTGPKSWNPVPAIDLANVEYSGASLAGCRTRLVGGQIESVRDTAPKCLPAGQTAIDLARVTAFDIPALDWDQDAGERLSLLAVAHSDEDPVLGNLTAPPPGDLLDVKTAVEWDNNVAISIATEATVPVAKTPRAVASGTAPEKQPCCEQRIKILLIAAAILAVVLIIYVIWRWSKGEFKLPVAYATLIVVLIILLIIWLKLPCCYTSAFG